MFYTVTFLRSKLAPCLLPIALAGIAACGDNYTAPKEDPGGEDVLLASCVKFDEPVGSVDSYPAIYDGTLAAATSALSVTVGQCASEVAPFGVETPGPDSTVLLSGLTPGAEYVLRMFSVSDLAMYVTTSCDEDLRGPGTDGCLLFVDESVQPPERGSFIAPPNGEAVVVVDYFLNASPIDPTFSLDVYEAECSSDDECTGDSGRCVDARCVECSTSYDCTNAATPICDGRTNACVGGDDTCSDDDDSEGFNDGPAGATDLTPAAGVGQSASSSSAICNNPSTELDFFSFDVASASSYTIDLDWAEAGLDLDLGVFNSEGRQLGASLWQRPESIELTYLPAGRYYLSVNLFGTNVAVAQPYSITVTRTGEDSCTVAADCATSYDTQLYRGDCQGDGACHHIEVEPPGDTGALCDTGDDCSSSRCTSFSFTADADTRSVCTTECTADDACSGQSDPNGAFVCTDYLLSNMCVPRCENDEQCAVLIGNKPTCTTLECNADPPTWTHLSCNVATGKCEL